MDGVRTSEALPDTARLLPLAVDLDGTLLATDTLHEGLVEALLRSPTAFPGLLRSLPEGRAAFKRRVSRQAPANAAELPLRQPFLDWLREQHSLGRELHLVTAANLLIKHLNNIPILQFPLLARIIRCNALPVRQEPQRALVPLYAS